MLLNVTSLDMLAALMLDPYVLIYVVKNDIITFLCVDHHDFVYEKAVKILEKWKREIED